MIYINENLKREDWHMFEVGKTRFNDQALREASRMTIHNMQVHPGGVSNDEHLLTLSL